MNEEQKQAAKPESEKKLAEFVELAEPLDVEGAKEVMETFCCTPMSHKSVG